MQWSLSGLNRVLKRTDETGSIERTKCAGRPRSVRCDDNIELIEQLALSLCACVKAKGGHFKHRLKPWLHVQLLHSICCMQFIACNSLHAII